MNRMHANSFDSPRKFLVLWQTQEADQWEGETPDGSNGSHMKGLAPGDTIYIAACDDRELYLLGALRVSKTGKHNAGEWKGSYFADGRSVAGPFQFLALGAIKWKLRFEHTKSTRLARSKSLLWQVRSRRQLSQESASLLLAILQRQQSMAPKFDHVFKAETRRLVTSVSKIERDHRVRKAALRRDKYTCSVCGLEPKEKYGAWARECLEVHHLRPLAQNIKRGPTLLRDVILVCPTCHRALHLFPSGPSAWRRLRHLCSDGY